VQLGTAATACGVWQGCTGRNGHRSAARRAGGWLALLVGDGDSAARKTSSAHSCTVKTIQITCWYRAWETRSGQHRRVRTVRCTVQESTYCTLYRSRSSLSLTLSKSHSLTGRLMPRCCHKGTYTHVLCACYLHTPLLITAAARMHRFNYRRISVQQPMYSKVYFEACFFSLSETRYYG
jgi:hypothetical protein